MRTRPYGVGALMQTALLDGAGDPPGITFASPTLVAGDAKRVTDELAIGDLTAEFVAFTSGSVKPAPGDAIAGATSTETAVVIGTVVTSGSWSGGDAAGYLFVEQVSGAFQAENLNNTTSSQSNFATIGADFTPSIGAVAVGTVIWFGLTSTEMACKQGHVQFADQAATVWAAAGVEFETYGHASSLHPPIDGSDFTDIPWNADWDAEVQSEVADAITAASLPTAAQIQAELEEDGASVLDTVRDNVATILGRIIGTLATGTHNPQSGDAYARLGAPAGASVSADVAAVKTDTGNLVTRITATLFAGITSLAEWLGLIAGKQAGDSTARTELRATGAGSGTFDETTDSQEAIRDTAPLGTAMRGTDNAALASVATEARLAELDAANIPANVDTLLGRVVGTLATGTHNPQSGDAYARLGAPAGASVSADIAALDVLLDSIIAEVVTAQGEPGQGAPPVSAPLADKVAYLYKAWRNRSNQTSTTHQLYADDGTTVDQKRTISDDGTTFESGEVATGP